MEPLGWRIYYADGSTFSSLDGAWAAAPAHGVQVVTTFYADTYRCWHGPPDYAGEWVTHHYRNVLHGALQAIDYYWLDGEQPVGGPADAIPLGTVPKVGTWTPDFPAILNRAVAEEAWP